MVLTLGPLGVVAWRAEGGFALVASDWAAVRFTVQQATLSAVLSVLLAIPVARALARRRFRGRRLLVTLMGAPFILPVIVAVLGLLAVFGRSGIVSQGLGIFGLPPITIYGLHGVVLAHVFFNLPLATRLILQGWLDIPSERFRLAASLGMSSRDVLRQIELPMLREVVPGALLLIFLVCTTSFAVALTLGGGPSATTVELAIYQAFAFEFDLGRAATLALVQVAIAGTAALAALRFSIFSGGAGGLDRPVQRWDARGYLPVCLDFLAIILAGFLLIMPLAMIVIDGVPAMMTLPGVVFDAALRSILVAFSSAALTIVAALAIALAVQHHAFRGLEIVGYLPVALSPLVIGVGVFVVIFPLADPASLALFVTAVVNALMSLPFALRGLVPAVRTVEARYGRTADALGMRGLARLRWLLLPRLRRPLGFGAGLAAALSMGDLGVIAFFAGNDAATLPLQIFRLMGAYRMEDAAGAALLLLLLSLLAFWVCDRGGRVDADA